MSWLSDDGLRVFLVLTVIIGGGAAFLAGRGLARSWKPFWRIFFYMALLAAAIRFFHYALFDGTLLVPLLLSRHLCRASRGRMPRIPRDADNADGHAISLALRAHQPADLARPPSLSDLALARDK